MAVSRTQFLEAVKQWDGLKYCILWVHSPAHTFSFALIKRLALLARPLCILHVFGFNSYDQMLIDCARNNKVNFISVKLGEKTTQNGWRWLTYQEISQQVLNAMKSHEKLCK